MLYLEEVPEVHKVSGEHEFFCLGDEAVGHEAEVLHKLSGAVNAGVHIQLRASQQPQQQVVDLVEDDGGVGRQWQLTGRQVERACGTKHLSEGVAGDEGDEEVRRRWREERQLIIRMRNEMQLCDGLFNRLCLSISGWFLMFDNCLPQIIFFFYNLLPYLFLFIYSAN